MKHLIIFMISSLNVILRDFSLQGQLLLLFISISMYCLVVAVVWSGL